MRQSIPGPVQRRATANITSRRDMSEPAPIQAGAVQRREYIRPGQGNEHILPHEAWHVPRRLDESVQSGASQGPASNEGITGGRSSGLSDPPGGGAGLPATLRSGVEALSGVNMGHVKVHRSSPQPASIQAYAFARGSHIHLGPGQEHHLPHEAWHVVQQAQGRVRPTAEMAGGVEINDERSLEREAEVMGTRALSGGSPGAPGPFSAQGHARESGSTIVQRASHGFLGTMIHYAREQGVDPPEPGTDGAASWKDPVQIDVENFNHYWMGGNLVEPRGRLVENTPKTYDWRFDSLATKLTAMRAKAGFGADAFPMVINANHMIGPGRGGTPESGQDEQAGIHAFGSVWSMIFAAPGENGKPLDTDRLLNFEEAIGVWKAAPDMAGLKRGQKPKKTLGDNAAKLLWRAAKAKIGQVGRNVATPHRGLRNAILENPTTTGLLDKLESRFDYVHVITLDSDVDIGDGTVISEIQKIAEEQSSDEKGGSSEAATKAGYNLTATDYIYSRTDFFEWFAGALDKFGRARLESEGFEPYPAEPGLTISYASASRRTARGFLAHKPFGPEVGDLPKQAADVTKSEHNNSKIEGGKEEEREKNEGDGKKEASTGNTEANATKDPFKLLVSSDQSVEGKNLRERYRRATDNARVFRTKAFLTVAESKDQYKPPKKTIQNMMVKCEGRKKITAADLRSLIAPDTYHSLQAERGKKKSDQPTEKADALDRIFTDAADVLNKALENAKYSTAMATLKPLVERLLLGIERQQLPTSMSGSGSTNEESSPVKRKWQDEEGGASLTTSSLSPGNMEGAVTPVETIAEQETKQDLVKRRRTLQKGDTKEKEKEKGTEDHDDDENKMDIDETIMS